MTRQAATPTRSFRIGCTLAALSATVLGVIAVIAVCIAAAVAVPAFFDRPDVPPEERLAKKAGLTEYRLRIAVQDGTLTDPEIAYAAGGRWSVERATSAIRVVVRYSPEGECYAYHVPRPLDDATVIRRSRLERCPAVAQDPT